ncbi:MAG: thermonuclease family protein [Pseudomonadota bacterium]
MRDSIQRKFAQIATAFAVALGIAAFSFPPPDVVNARAGVDAKEGMDDSVDRDADGPRVVKASLASSQNGRGSESFGPVISGKARVIDGDTIAIKGARVRLEGIDAPENAQLCPSVSGGKWPCGRAATRTLTRLIAGRNVQCTTLKTDRYDRAIALCKAGVTDINEMMIRTGNAWAFTKYSTRYQRLESQIRTTRIGIWQTTGAVPPWVFRRGRWNVAEQTAPTGCAIKGNITKNGRIYHMPWSRWYAKTRIDTRRGEQWFCSESDAKAAGWRPAVNS